ncbi:MAG: DUF6434 domain-containing protein [Lewinella sp.]
MARPDFGNVESGAEFNSWYWLKAEMQAFCKLLGLPSGGRKFDLRDRIMYALDHDRKLLPKPRKRRPESTFDWKGADLNLDTVVTDNISFGPNFRNFLAGQIDRKFTCTSDFMDWVREHEGATLAECIAAWYELDNRRRDPTFRREIADNNMFCQYVRDFYDHDPEAPFQRVKDCWNWKRRQPMAEGAVVFSASDDEDAPSS